MKRGAVLLDSNVLYPAPMRDVFLQLAVMDIIRAKWTAAIHREWIAALLRNEPGRDRAFLERTRDLMDSHVRDCLVVGYEGLIPQIDLPDPDDRHVLAAAISGRCELIVTQNLKDFPQTALLRHGVSAQHLDVFLCDQFALAPGAFCAAIRKVRARLKKPPYSVQDYLANLDQIGLTAIAATLGKYQDWI